MYKWRGGEVVFPWFSFFCNSEVGNAKGVLQEYSYGCLLHFGWFLFFRNGNGKTFCICATHCGFLLWPHSKASFDMRLGLGKSVISHVNLGFSQPHLAMEKFLHESLLSQLLWGWEGGVTILPYPKSETFERRTRSLETLKQIKTNMVSSYLKYFSFPLLVNKNPSLESLVTVVQEEVYFSFCFEFWK